MDFHKNAGMKASSTFEPRARRELNPTGSGLSDGFQGAGGVGGLLAVEIETGTDAGVYYPTYDGNGNISEYLDGSGATVAHYEYDPFGGEATTPTGGKSGLFSYRFSTKPQDTESGFYYYGYRYYDPVSGRWPSRDPIEEMGGLNLYGFLDNDGADWIDVLGWGPGGSVSPILPGSSAYPTEEVSDGESSENGERCECPEDIGKIKNLKMEITMNTLGGSAYSVKDPLSTLLDSLPGLAGIRGKKETPDNKAKRRGKGGLGEKMRDAAQGFAVEEILARLVADVCMESSSGKPAWRIVEGNGSAKPSNTIKNDPEGFANEVRNVAEEAADDFNQQLPQ